MVRFIALFMVMLASGLSWDLALGRHLGQILPGAAAVAVMGYWAPSFVHWLLPVVAGLLLAPLLAVYSSCRSLGLGARRWRMFMTPEERRDESRRLPVT